MQNGTFKLFPARAAFDAELSSQAKEILLALCFCANENGECFPSQEYIANRLGRGMRSVQSAYHELVDRGYIRVKRRQRETMRIEIVFNLDPQENAHQDTLDPQENAHQELRPADFCSLDPQIPAQNEPSHNIEVMRIKLNENKADFSEKTEKSEKRELRSKNLSLKEKQAEEIYLEFPRHVGKGAAIKAILKALTIETLETLLAKTREYADSGIVKQHRQGGNIQFIPHPATWFNQERWKDDPSEWAASSLPAKNQNEKPPDAGIPNKRQAEGEIKERTAALNEGIADPIGFIRRREKDIAVLKIPLESLERMKGISEYCEALERCGISPPIRRNNVKRLLREAG